MELISCAVVQVMHWMITLSSAEMRMTVTRITHKRGLTRMLRRTPQLQGGRSRPLAATHCSRALRLRLASF